MKTWLLVDVNYLCHRAKHTTGSLSFDGQGTGIAFGVLRALEDAIGLFSPGAVVLACDHPSLGHRKRLLSTYKSSRWEKMSEQEKDDRKEFDRQLHRFKKEILPLAGYRNIVQVPGYEADDIIAQYARDLPDKDDAVIVSADQDLWQCLRQGVDIYNPTSKKILTATMFKNTWKIDPRQWAMVKCLAGCKTDDVEGIDDIGEKSAAGFFNGELQPSKDPKKVGRYEKIEANLHLIKQNMPLVRLPFPGLVLPDIVEDELTEASKVAAQELLGIRPARRTDRQKVASKKKQQEMEGFDI